MNLLYTFYKSLRISPSSHNTNLVGICLQCLPNPTNVIVLREKELKLRVNIKSDAVEIKIQNRGYLCVCVCVYVCGIIPVTLNIDRPMSEDQGSSTNSEIAHLAQCFALPAPMMIRYKSIA